MKLNYAVFSDKALKDENGKAVIFGIFDVIQVKTTPTKDAPLFHPTMSFAFSVKDVPEGKHEKIGFKLKYLETGEIVFAAEGTYELDPVKMAGLTGHFNIEMLPIIGLGTYRGELLIAGTEVVAVDLEVRLLN